jgi:hypothetical protein
MVVWVKELSGQVIGAGARYRLLFLIFNLGMRVVKVDRDYLLRYRRPERARDHASYTVCQIEAKHWIISCGSWFK